MVETRTVRAPQAATSSDRVQRVALAVLAVPNAVVGLWAVAAPRSWYDEFPGAGRHWVSPDGPFNEHLVRDVGALSLGLVVLLAVAAWKLQPALVRTAAAVASVAGLPHFVYHLFNLDPLESADQVGALMSLGLGLVLPVVVLAASRNGAAART